MLMLLSGTTAYSQSFLFTLDMEESGSKQYSASDIKIVFGGGSMLITQDNKTDAVLMKDINKIYFTDNVLSIKKVSARTKIFYNPTTNLLSLETPNSESATVKIFNIVGQAILNTQHQGSSSIDISSIRSGVYIVQINDECLKFIKP